MAPSIQHVAPGRLRIGEGGGCMGLFGLPFFGAGVSMILASLGFVPLNNEGAVPALVWLVLGLMGLVFALVGGTLAFGRAGRRWVASAPSECSPPSVDWRRGEASRSRDKGPGD